MRSKLQPDWAYLETRAHAAELQIAHLSPSDASRLASIGFDRVRSLELYRMRCRDLQLLRLFPAVEKLHVWYSPAITSLSGVEHSKSLRWLALSDLGALSTLQPLTSLGSLTELIIEGGTQKDQKLVGDLEPLAELTGLKRLTITNVSGLDDLTPLLGFEGLEWLQIDTDRFSREAVAQVAAKYPFYADARPWFGKFAEDASGCARCGEKRFFVMLRGTKQIGCGKCDVERMEKVLADFDALINTFRQ